MFFLCVNISIYFKSNLPSLLLVCVCVHVTDYRLQPSTEQREDSIRDVWEIILIRKVILVSECIFLVSFVQRTSPIYLALLLIGHIWCYYIKI